MFSRHVSKFGRTAIAGFSLLISSSSLAITLTNSNSAGGNEAAMTAALQGTGVTISNLTITNPGSCTNFRRGVGTFTSGTSGGAGPVLSEPNGVVIANADLTDVATGTNALDTSNSLSNNTNTLCDAPTFDADMVLLEAGTSAGEYAAIEFDVVPTSTTLAIPFQFGSEEFPEYVCSIYTDIVGIFVSGPGITSTTPVFSSPPSTGTPYENYAKTDSGDLSSINWVNTGVVGGFGNIASCTAPNGSLANSAYYTDNSNGFPTGGADDPSIAITNSNLELDGFTNTLFQPITVVPGQTYRVKIAVADTQDRTYDSAAFIHPLFSTGTFSGFDYGDAPDTYGTLTSSGGPSHGIDTSIYLGGLPDNEVTGIPSVGADGDDLDGTDDEDGVASFPILLQNATTYSVDVNVTNNSGSNARLVGWIDFDASGTFEASEGTQTIVPTGTTGATVSLDWSGLSGLVSGNTYARIRFSSDISLSTSTTGSAMSDGEVEDYALPVAGVTFTKYVSTDPTCTDTLQTLTVSVGTNVYYCYTVTNPNTFAFTITASSDDQVHDISALQTAYAAAASNTVVIGPLTAGGVSLPIGVTTVNNASVTANIGGNSVAVNDSASLTVTTTLPASGIKRLYFDAVDNFPGDAILTRDPNDLIANTETGNINGNNTTFTLNQAIPFTSPFTITGGTTVDVQMSMQRRQTVPTTFDVELFKEPGNTSIGSASSSITWPRRTYQTITVPIDIGASDVTFNTGEYISLVITNTSGANNRRLRIQTEDGADKSQIIIRESSTVINVDNIEIFAETYNLGAADAKFSSYNNDGTATAYIRATISDPFGSDDITGATITLDDPLGTPPELIIDAAMTEIPAATTAGSKLFEYAYPITAGAPQGFWPLSVTGLEGYETEVSHTRTGTMIVGAPAITISKNSEVVSDAVNASDPKAIPSAIVEYTVSLENSGYGYVDSGSTVITDPLGANTTFYFGSPLDPATFVDGANSSGLSFTFIDLASVVDDIDFSNNGGVSFITPTVDANGFDTTVPPINFIRLNPKGEFLGSDGTNHPSMELKFRVRVE